MEKFFGSWKVEPNKDEGMDKLEKAMGVPDEKRAMWKEAIRSVKDNGDGTYAFEFKSGTISKSHNAKLGECFEVERIDGSKLKITMTLEGNELIENIEVPAKNKTMALRNVREGDEIIMNVVTGRCIVVTRKGLFGSVP